MTLLELLENQKELNEHCPRYPFGDELTWALMAEIGELAQAVKGDWCWWKRYGKAFDNQEREAIAAEIADILCFLLTGILHPIDGSMAFVESGLDETRYCWGATLEDLEPLDHSDLRRLMLEVAAKFYLRARMAFQGVFLMLEFTHEEIEAAYLAKCQVNRDRWATPTEELTAENQ